jgi:hypothetical protein
LLVNVDDRIHLPLIFVDMTMGRSHCYKSTKILCTAPP